MAPSRSSSPGQLSALLADLARVPEGRPQEAIASTLRAGMRVDRFELVRELGRGSFGVVYEARDVEDGRLVAFKVVRPGQAGVATDQLQHEAETIARLSHPSLVALLGVGRCEAGPYLVLELLRGGTLKQRLRQGAVPPAETLRIVTEVALGLAHAHGRGVVHRDLKPSNVFLCEDGSVRLLDFGLAHAFGRRRLDGGTPDFMAPEQWRGAPEDERTDVFALGVLLYGMLAGELPFPDDAGRTVTSSQPAPRLEVPDLPGLGELVARMLEKDPVDRPRDAAEVAGLLAPLGPRDGSTVGTGGRAVRIRRRWRRRVLAAAAALGGAALGISAVVATRAARPEPAAVAAVAAAPPVEPAAAPSLVVIPFADLSPRHDQAFLAEGLAEEIRSTLARVEGLKVVGRTSSLAVRDRRADAAATGRLLGVEAILEGSVRVEGDRLRLEARLVGAATGQPLWAEVIEGEVQEVFAWQDRITSAVVAALHVRLLPGRAPTSRAFRTRDPRVYAAYLQGRRLQTGEALREWLRAEEAYRQALALDPGYAPAWAGLASTIYFGHGNSGTSPEAMKEGRAAALLAAERAVALAPDLADGYLARGQLRFWIQRDLAGAQADLRRALALSPGESDALWINARYMLGSMGQLTQALADGRRAAELDPLSYKPWSSLSALYLANGQLAQARQTAQRSLELEPRQDSAANILTMVELLEGRPAAALEATRRVGDPVFRLQFEAMARHSLGERAEAGAALQKLIRENAQDSAYQVAFVYAWLDEPDLAFQWLDRAIAQEDGAITDLLLDPPFQKLEKDPRFPRLLARIGVAAR